MPSSFPGRGGDSSWMAGGPGVLWALLERTGGSHSRPIPRLVARCAGLLRYLHVIESQVMDNVDIKKTEGIELTLDIWGKCSPVLVAGGYTPENANYAVDKDYVNNEVTVMFGRHFLANPDLPFCIQHGIPLTKYDRTSFYTLKMTIGYMDYPFSPEFLAKHKN